MRGATRPFYICKMNHLNYQRGAFFALLGPVVGIAAWILLWESNIIASASAFLLAWLTIKLYKKGAGGNDAKSLYIILPYIAIGALAAFLGGILADGLRVITANVEGITKNWFELLATSDFWDFMWANASTAEFWQGYGTDILISVAFIAVGTYGTIAEAVTQTRPAQTQEQQYV